MSRLGALLPLAFLLFVVVGHADAYTTMSSPPSVWMRDWTTDGVHWVLNDGGCPDVSFEATEASLVASFEAWEDVDCAVIWFTYDGPTPQSTTGNDGINVMVWRTSGWPYGSGALGVTGTWFGGGVMSDADIEFNSVNWTWSDHGDGRTMDIQTVATHEIGHLLGLGHSDQSAAVMFPSTTGAASERFLNDDDRAGVCFLYPSATGGCATEDDCPEGFTCQAGDCVPSGSGEVCAPCGSPADCPAGECVRYPDGTARCGANCRTDEDCAAVPGCGARPCACLEMSGGGSMQCAPVDLDCVEGAECTEDDHCPDGYECIDEECVPRGCSELGATCETRVDCCSGVCVDGLCSQPCDWLSPADSCPNGFYCGITECGVGNCVPGELGSTRRGEACAEHGECATGYCASTGGPTACAVPCDPDGIDTCPDDWSCQRIGASHCGLCTCNIGLIGDPCEELGDCASGLCATKSGDRRCSRFCGTGDPCPEGYDCLDAGVRSICWPALGGLGAGCESDEECTTGICRGGQCTRPCESGCSCARGFECREVDGEQVCVEGSDGGGGRGCDCSAAGDRAAPAATGFVICVLPLLLLLRRRA